MNEQRLHTTIIITQKDTQNDLQELLPFEQNTRKFQFYIFIQILKLSESRKTNLKQKLKTFKSKK